MSTLQIKVWHKRFKDGWESVESVPCSGRPATNRTRENVECVWAAINKDQQLTVWELEAYLGIQKTTVSKILMQDLGMKRVMANFILQLLLPEQKEHRAAVGRIMWGGKMTTLKGTEPSLSHVQCFLYLVSSSINVSIFHSTWLDTFWPGIVWCSPEKKSYLNQSFQVTEVQRTSLGKEREKG